MISYVTDRLPSLGGRAFIAGDAAHTMPSTGGLEDIQALVEVSASKLMDGFR
jgi:2-polyprenyl-6-methoxyphenol hydroxylase-like FAD-dependent oxidoreductase